MNCHELATEQYYDLPVITFVFNNGVLGMVRQWQTLIYDKNYSQTTLDRAPDFVKLAEAYGLRGARVSNVEQLEAAIREALAWGHGYVIDCTINMDEMVRPMVGGGSPITKFIIC
jgi:acetolactate synthase-1/2/3 large subunit